MHILIPVLHRPENPTGVCRHGANLAQCLAESDRVTQVTVVIGAWQSDYFASSFNLASSKIKLIEIDIKNSSLARNAWFLFDLPRLANQLTPDLVHLSFPLPFIRRWFKSPVVATIHDLYPYECPDNFGYPQVWFNQWFLRQCVQQSDGLSCVSQITRDSLLTYFPALARQKPVRVIYNSVDFAKLESQRPRLLPPDRPHRFILSVAQHRRNKNLDLLVKAYNNLRSQQRISPKTDLVLVGSVGPETQNLTQLVASLGLTPHVTFLSALEDSELRWLYEQADLFVIPSSTEGFCLPLVEAQALGCPAVCSDIPIFREVAAPGCHYFSLEKKPLENLTATMAIALANPGRVAPHLNPNFLSETISQNYLDLYQHLIP